MGRRGIGAIGHGFVSVRFTILRCLMHTGGSSGEGMMASRTLCAGPHQKVKIPLTLTDGRLLDVMMCVGVIQTSEIEGTSVLICQRDVSPGYAHNPPAEVISGLTIGQGLGSEAFWLQPSDIAPTTFLCLRVPGGSD